MACNAFRVTSATAIAGIFVLVLGSLIGWIVLPLYVRDKIAEVLPLRENSESWNLWEKPPVPIYFHVYVFHVNNPEEILKGGLPIVTEYGPYVYREKREKTVLSVDEEKSRVIYQQKTVFEFDQKASGNLTEDDVYTVVNLHTLSLSQTVNNLKVVRPVIQFVDAAIEKMWPNFKSNPVFIKAKVKDYLFEGLQVRCNQRVSKENLGVKILCETIKLVDPKTMEFDVGKKGIHSFSIFKYRNNSNDGTYEIDLGINDVTQIGKIKRWNGLKMLFDWKGKGCNQILGTDGSLFRPFLDTDGIESLHVYNTGICRSVKLTHESDIQYKGVPGKRFVMDKDVFASTLENHENYCYCPQSIKGITHFGGCLKSGVVELSSCQRVPIIISHPHFLMADPSYQKIEGLKPEETKHKTYVDIEPNSGYLLSAASRLQINVFLQRIQEITVMKNLPGVLMPSVWVEEKVDLTDELTDEIKTKILKNLEIIEISRWTVVGIGITVTLTSFIYLAKLKFYQKNYKIG